MIGLFGISEVLRNALHLHRETDQQLLQRHDPLGMQAVLQVVFPLAWRRKFHLLRSSVTGAIIGMLPGAGADIAAWISYATSKRLSPQPEEYGRGSMEGLGDATGANNAALGGAWIPALVFGIPGDSVTAIAIGVLLMKNITPGPGIFDASANPHQATLVTSIYVTFVIANLLLIPLGLAAIRVGSLLVNIPRRVLLPLIVLFCVVGSYAMSGSYFDVWVMLAMGLLGFVFESCRIPLGPIVLGLIMGGQLEHRFLQCLTRSAELKDFFASPISIVLALICLASWVLPGLVPRHQRHGEQTHDPNAGDEKN
jgi:TctA family transporter